jgi:predicted dehydrogenase
MAAAGVAVSVSGGSTAPAARSRVIGANQNVRIAVAGLRGKGAQHADLFNSLPGVRVVALCDPDRDVLAYEKDRQEKNGRKADGYNDIRKLLEKKDVDALVIAAPNHWHALMAVWACQAGKDAYVEKPVSHNVWEGRKIVEAAEKYGRVVQAGTQHRSDEGLAGALETIWRGELGEIKLVRGFCYKRRNSIGKAAGPQPIPPAIDYDLWTGPAPLKPLMRKQLHYDWHWFWDTGNGDIGNQGIHEVDMCRWALRVQGYPERVVSMGGRYGYADDAETPNTQITLYDYGVPVIFEVRGLPKTREGYAMDSYKGVRIGIVVECENGYFAGGAGGGWTYDPNGKRLKQFVGDGGRAHAQNFIDAVRSRDASGLHISIEQGHVSSALCHLANISYRLGHSLSGGALKESIAHRPELTEAFGRFQDHLSSNGVSIDVAPTVMGPWLDFLNDKEQFASLETYDAGFWANRLLKRDYRPPFIVPENV